MSPSVPAHPAPSLWTRKHSVGALGTVLLAALVGLLPVPSLIAWLSDLILMGAFTVIVADGVTGSRLGVLIDERNRISLSRLQTASWTLLILSAFLAAALGNVRAGAPDPLAIAIPQATWTLLGISAAALVGSPLILGTKRSVAGLPADRRPTSPMLEPDGITPSAAAPPPAPPAITPIPARCASVLRAQGDDPDRMRVDGTLVLRNSIDDSRWADLFKGDEESTIATLDLSKVQMFFFTLILVFSYGAALGATFTRVDAAREASPAGTEPAPAGKADPRRVDEFPPLDGGLVTLLGISNAGYLAYKAVPRGQAPA